jgi:hypothetical protein
VEDAAVGDAVAGRRAGAVAGVGAFEEWVNDVCRLEGFATFLSATVVFAAGEAKEVVRVYSVL